MSELPPASASPPSRRDWIIRLLAIAAFAVLVIALARSFGNQQILLKLAAGEEQLRAVYRDHPLATLAAALVLYVLVTGLSIPGALPLSLTYGWLFGFVPGVIVVSFASTGGATLAFLLSRNLVGNWVQARYGEKLAWFNAAIEREGAFFLVTLRLVPYVPFWLVNLLAGLTKIRVTTFWWASQLGMLPGTLVFIWAGSSAPKLKEIAQRGMWSFVDWRIFVALALLAVFPFVARLIVRPAARS
ncbi:MAG TPA: TVP38/TMEM64 family protein [Pirellulaceae bacterium]|nr:TVP38/TMEM64 family protein [Pirellulaceae bacterium]